MYSECQGLFLSGSQQTVCEINHSYPCNAGLKKGGAVPPVLATSSCLGAELSTGITLPLFSEHVCWVQQMGMSHISSFSSDNFIVVDQNTFLKHSAAF
jgi:hypothetical protein